MRQSPKETFVKADPNRLLSVDFHDFLMKEAVLTDYELSNELGLSMHEVRILKNKMVRR